MTTYLHRLIFLCFSHVIVNCYGLSITGPADKNITEGMTVPIECQVENHGIVFKFTHHNSPKYVAVAECDFKNSSVFIDINFRATHTIAHMNHTCILTILYLREEQCGTYSCAELYMYKEYVNYTISCNEMTFDVKNTQDDTGTKRSILIVVVCVLCAAAITSVPFVIHHKRCNTYRAKKSFATSTDCELHLVESGQQNHETFELEGAVQRNNHDDDVENEGGVPDEARKYMSNVLDDLGYGNVKESENITTQAVVEHQTVEADIDNIVHYSDETTNQKRSIDNKCEDEVLDILNIGTSTIGKWIDIYQRQTETMQTDIDQQAEEWMSIIGLNIVQFTTQTQQSLKAMKPRVERMGLLPAFAELRDEIKDLLELYAKELDKDPHPLSITEKELYTEALLRDFERKMRALTESTVTEGKRADPDDVPTFSMNAAEAVSKQEEIEIYSRNNASLNNQQIREIIQTRAMDQKLKDEVLNILNIETYKKSRNTFDRQHFGNQLIKGQLTRSQSVLNALEKETWPLLRSCYRAIMKKRPKIAFRRN